jgi:hypothetical protein
MGGGVTEPLSSKDREEHTHKRAHAQQCDLIVGGTDIVM